MADEFRVDDLSVLVERDLDNVAALVSEPSEVGSFVLLTLAADELSVRVDPERLRNLLKCNRYLKGREVRAG